MEWTHYADPCFGASPFSLTAAPKLGMLPPVNQGIVRIASRLRYGSLARALMLAALTMTVTSCAGSGSAPSVRGDSAEMIRIQLDGADPAASSGEGLNGVGPKRFQVGFGRNGIACAGTRFEEGWTPLGTFRVNAILSADRFAMDPDLVKLSGKSEDYLRENLFRNMSAIDFKGDGETGEYGVGYVSLAPVPATPQPFRFNTYDGQFRWYSFAIHGTNDDSRVGQAVTGGCINVNQSVMAELLKTVQLGDEVVINSDTPCTP